MAADSVGGNAPRSGPCPEPRVLSGAELLELLPQQEPFRFVDQILEVDEAHIVSRYTFPADAGYYRGHFPGNPITPGVLLIESMAQTGVVALGIYLVAKQWGREKVARLATLFTDVSAEFTGVVKPGDTVTITAKKVFFRHMKIRAEVEMHRYDDTLVASAVVSGMGVDLARAAATKRPGRA